MNQLPWELEEKILSLVPIKSFGRFRSVCKRWNTLFDDKSFVNKLLSQARPQFILLSDSKICSVNVNLDNGPSIEVYDLPSDIPGYVYSTPISVEYCDGLLMYVTTHGTVVCNPWLKQSKWTKFIHGCNDSNGIGYDNSRPDKHYKIFQSYCSTYTPTVEAKITEFGSHTWKSHQFGSDNWSLPRLNSSVSLNGTLYWIAFYRDSHKCFIQSFDFSTERFKPYCSLPSKYAHPDVDASSLAVYKEDRFSFLEQDYYTKNIEIWVTKGKIKNGDGDDVEWMNLMNVSFPEWSSVGYNAYPPSYFIDEDKSLTLVLCGYNKERNACIYIAKEDKFHEIKINDLVDFQPRHRTYFPSLVQIPTFTMSGKGENQQVGSRFALPKGVEARDGVGASEWDDGFFDDVKKISLGWNKFGVVFVKFNYCNGNTVVVGAVHGNATTRMAKHDILIADDDYVEAVMGTYTESHITSIAFRMHKKNSYRQYDHYGCFDGKSFALERGGGSKIIGFYGRSSDIHLTALGVHRSASV